MLGLALRDLTGECSGRIFGTNQEEQVGWSRAGIGGAELFDHPLGLVAEQEVDAAAKTLVVEREGFAIADFRERFGRNFECIFGGVATPLFNNGLLTLDRGRIKLTDRGLEMADSVFAEFV